MTAETIEQPNRTFSERMLDGVERVGNKVPHPAMLFVYLIVGVVVLSQILFWFNVKASYEVVAPPPQQAQESYYGGVRPSPMRWHPPSSNPARITRSSTKPLRSRGC